MPVTLSDVARRAGVSMKTVSRVVNNETRVADTTRQKVLTAIEELGYAPNVWAQRLARGHSGLVGLVMHDATPAYIMDVMNGLMDVGDATGYRISLYRYDVKDPREVAKIVAMAAQQRVEGLIFTPPTDNSPDLVRALQDLGFPFVQLTPQDRCSSCAWVAATDEQGSYDAAHYLIGLGHRRIGFIQGNLDHVASWDRLNGYKNALTSSNIVIDQQLIVGGGWQFENGLACAHQLLTLDDPPTAILAANDDVAAGVIQAAWERDWKCPEQLSIVGFDDVPLARQLTPPLTTVRQPIYRIAVIAMTMLVEELIPGIPTDQSVLVPTEFIPRKSTGPHM